MNKEIKEAKWFEQIRQIMWGRDNPEEWWTICIGENISTKELDRVAKLLLGSKMLVLYFVLITRYPNYGRELGYKRFTEFIDEDSAYSND